MIKITKEGEPDFWTNFKRKNPEVNYYQLSNSEAGIQVRKTERLSGKRAVSYLLLLL